MTLRSRALGLAASILLVAIARSPAAGARAAESLRIECDYGVTLALEGRFAAAESVFTSLLSHAPGDTRALTNLGNIHLLRGEREAALAFYGLASGVDTADAGILLNRATAHYLMGEDSLARAEAGIAVARAGGGDSAESLLGFNRREAHDESAKAADMSARMQFPLRRPVHGQRLALTRAELHALITASPNATTRPASPARSPAAPPVASDSEPLAGLSPASYERNAAAVLYWKH